MNFNKFNFNGDFIPEPPKEKKKIGRKLLAGIFGIWFVSHVFSSDMFESQPPKVEISKIEYWNLKTPLNIKISDNKAIKSYKVSLDNSSGDGQLVEYTSGQFKDDSHQEVDVNITLANGFRNNYTTIAVDVTDTSNWHFWKGNSTSIKETVIVDIRKPIVSILSNSYSIRRGGLGAVIFKVDDEALDDVYVESSSGRKFFPQPFDKSDSKYYIALVAWHLHDPSFKGSIIAKDRAGNTTSIPISIILQEKTYKVSNITLQDNFLTGKVAELASQHPKFASTEIPTEHFKIINEDIRAENEKLIYEITTQINKTKLIEDFSISPFLPLKGSANVATFGDHRKYYYQDSLVSEATHFGLDLASVKTAPIILSNYGEVALKDNLGVYGEVVIVDHGLGLYSLYSHCSSIRVNVGDVLDRGNIIANTGVTGLVLGDHLHFGLYVQGVPIRPEELMDKQSIKSNISDVITNAKQLIVRQQK